MWHSIDNPTVVEEKFSPFFHTLWNFNSQTGHQNADKCPIEYDDEEM